MNLAGLSGWRQPHITQPAPPPVIASLLLHFDYNLVDAVSTNEFLDTGTFYPASVNPAFNRQASRAETDDGMVADWASALTIGTQPFTIEGRCNFPPGTAGGVLIAKNYFPSEPAPGQYNLDWAFWVGPTFLRMSWTDAPFPNNWIEAEIAPAEEAEFAWAISDDGTLIRFYVDGSLVHSATSVALASTPPGASSAEVSLFNALQGFLGSTPNWGYSGFSGRVDELRLVLGQALYTGSTYTVATVPFTPS